MKGRRGLRLLLGMKGELVPGPYLVIKVRHGLRPLLEREKICMQCPLLEMERRPGPDPFLEMYEKRGRSPLLKL